MAIKNISSYKLQSSENIREENSFVMYRQNGWLNMCTIPSFYKCRTLLYVCWQYISLYPSYNITYSFSKSISCYCLDRVVCTRRRRIMCKPNNKYFWIYESAILPHHRHATPNTLYTQPLKNSCCRIYRVCMCMTTYVFQLLVAAVFVYEAV